MGDPNRNALWARLIIEELYHSGVRHVCISPGSRSTPLSLATVAHGGLEATVHLDERTASFFALGLARESGQPVALICTSGSAGAHYHPALIEAYYSRVPLIALTADRPEELMDCGSGQTIAQPGMFGPHVVASLALDPPVMDALNVRHVRHAIARVIARAVGVSSQPGPVHVNVPFREPLEPVTVEGDVPDDVAHMARAGDGSALRHVSAPKALAAAQLDALAAQLRAARRVAIVAGPTLGHAPLEAAKLHELAKRIGAPILADPLSELRHGPDASARICGHYDVFMRHEPWRRQTAPQLVLRFGMMPTSKVYRFWREAHPEAQEILVDPHAQAFDPVQQAQQLIVADPNLLVEGLLARIERNASDTTWNLRWILSEQAAREAVAQALDEDDALWEGYIARAVLKAAAPAQRVCIASSMPIRDIDAFGGVSEVPKVLLSSRGANGIDGLNATAFGVACAAQAPVISLLGDVAFFHDVGGLMAAYQAPPVTIVVINNAGGGIFSYLPISAYPEHFERLFLTPPQAKIEPIAAAYDLGYERVATRAQLERALASEVTKSRIIEVIVDREDNVRRHRRCWQHVATKLEELHV